MIVISFFKKLVDRKHGKVKFKLIPKTDEEYISIRKVCFRFIDSYRFLSSDLDSLFKTIFGNSHKTVKDLKEEIVDIDELLNIVNEIEKLIKEDRYNIDSIKDLKKDNPDKIEKLEAALLDYTGKKILKF